MIVKTVFNDMFFYKLESQSNTNMRWRLAYLYVDRHLMNILVIRCNFIGFIIDDNYGFYIQVLLTNKLYNLVWDSLTKTINIQTWF